MERIADFMSSPALCIDAQSTAEEGAKQMCDKNITSLLVIGPEVY